MRNQLASLIVLLAFPALLSAQRNNIIKLDLHAPIFRTGIVTYERVANENVSFLLSVLYSDKTQEMSNSDYLTRIAVTPEFRYYLQDFAAPRGFFVGGYLRYQWMRSEQLSYGYDSSTGLTYSTGYTSKEISTFGLGINVGIQEVFKDRIAVELFIGPLWNSGDEQRDLSDPTSTEPNERFKPYVGYFMRTGVNVGIAF